MAKNEPTYEELNSELEQIIAELQRDDTDIDTAVQHYQRGLELVKKLENHLETASNSLEELKASFES